MDIDPNELTATNNEQEQRYEAQVNGYTAVIEYERSGERIIFTHTSVPEPLEGHGIAGSMAHAALEDAHALHLSVVPRCPYVAAYIRRHPAYIDLVAPEYREQFGKSNET